jgi:glutathione S-transferase
MEDTYKLIYFNFRSRAEPIRLIFALADVPYEDFRFDKSKWTPEMKNSTPWGQVPILEVNGKRLAQSSAICRYLARRFNLTGANDFEAAKCDELVDSMMDLRDEWKAYFKEDDQERRAVLKKSLLDVALPKYLPKFESIIKNSEGEFLLGNNVTWADLHIAHTLQNLKDTVIEFCLDDYPNLQKFTDAVFNIPKIKTWVEKRPKTER